MIDDWKRFAGSPCRDLRHFQDKLLTEYLRDEIAPFHSYYRELFRKEGIDPSTFESREDLKRIPFTTKQGMIDALTEDRTAFVIKPTPELIREHWPISRKIPLLLAKVTRGAAAAKAIVEREYLPIFMTATTGRTSDPIPFLYTQTDMRRLADAGHRTADVLGFTSADRGINMFPYAPHLAFWQVAFAGLEGGVFMLSTGGGKTIGTRGNLRMIEKIKPSAIIGVPSYVYHVMRLAQEKGVSLENLKRIVLGAEKITETQKQKLKEIAENCGATDTHVMGTYGFTEAKLAWTECPGGSGYHLYPDMGLFEIVHPETGEVVGEGESGEIVFTSIGARGSAVVRYRTNDYAEGGITNEPCPNCGRTVPRLSSKITRLSNVIGMQQTKIKGTQVDLNHIAAILGEYKEIEEWQLELRKRDNDPNETDEMILYVALGERARLERDVLIRHIEEATEVKPNDVVFESLDKLNERTGLETEMKEKRFVDNRPK